MSGCCGQQGRLRIAFVVHDYNRVLGHSRYVAELAEIVRAVAGDVDLVQRTEAAGPGQSARL